MLLASLLDKLAFLIELLPCFLLNH